MAKDVKNAIEVLDIKSYGIEKINELLNNGKTLIIALENGEHVSQSLNEGYSEFLKANIELKEEKENCGTCGCGKPANVLLYAWR